MNGRAMRFRGGTCALALWAYAAGAAARAPAAAAFPQGVYAAEEYTMTFADAGQFRVSVGEKVMVEGEYTIKGDRLRLTDKRGPIACTRAGQETGTYGWKYDGETLTLAKIEDPCEPRSAALTAQPWKRTK